MTHQTRRPGQLLLVLEIILVIFLGVASLALVDQTNSASHPRLIASPNSVTIFLTGDVVGDHPGWNNTTPGPTITVINGQTVHLLLNATDFIMHNWFIDTLRNSSPDPNGISSPDFSAFTTKVLNFTFTPIIGQNIPSAGNWTYRCKYHPPYMYGTIQVLRPDFTLASAATTLRSTVNTPATTTISIGSVAHFTGAITLSTTGSSGLQTSITPMIVESPGIATLIVKGLAAGNYTATVTGTNGTVVHTISIAVETGDFTINTNPTIIPAQIHTPATATITLIPINHYTGTADISSNSTLCTLNPTTIAATISSTLSCTFQTSGQFTVQLSGTNGPLTHSATAIFDVAVPDYSVSSSLASIEILAGQSANATIDVQPINGFTGQIVFSTQTYAGLSCSLARTTIMLGPAETTTLNCRGNIGDYFVTVTGTNGTILRSTFITVRIEDFTLNPATAQVSLIAKSTAVATITVNSVNGFSRPITIQAAGSPGLDVTAPPTTNAATITLVVSAQTGGNYTVTVVATSSTLQHSTTISVQVQDFQLISATSEVSLTVGQTGTASIRISQIDQYSKTVLLTTNDTFCTINPGQTAPSTNTTLSCSFATAGTFHVMVTASNGSLSRSTTTTFVVANIQETSGTTLSSLLPTIAIVAAISIAAIVGITFYIRRGRPR